MKWLLVIAFTLIVSKIHSHPLEEVLTNSIEADNGSSSEDTIDLSHYGSRLYGNPSQETGDLLKNWKETDNTNPEEMGEYLEGDILFPKPQGRNGIVGQSYRWPNGVIPFVIQGNFNAQHMNTIEQAFNVYHKNTCVKFVPRMSEANYIVITSDNTGCWSSVGKIGGRQEVNIQVPGCITKIGTVIHELMHAVGFMHEQNRWERDGFVSINYANVKKGTENNFDKASKSTTDGFGVPYDYGSVMHYTANAFSINGRPTIVAKKNVGDEMGQREGFSQKDIEKINNMYKCK